MIEKTEKLTEQESLEIIKEAIIEHSDDVNIPSRDYELWENLVEQAPNSLDGQTGIKEKLNYTIEDEKGLVDLADNESGYNDYYQIVNWNLQIRLEAALVAYHSPYPEVRAVADCYDCLLYTSRCV